MCQCGKRREACGCVGPCGQPRRAPQPSERGGGDPILQLRLGQAHRARTAQARRTDRLGQRAFPCCASRRLLRALCWRLPLARGLEGCVLVAGAHCERPRWGGRLGTGGACRTGLALRPCKPHRDDGRRVAGVSGDPLSPPTPVRTGGHVHVPGHHARGHIAPLLGCGLPTRVRVYWSP